MQTKEQLKQNQIRFYEKNPDKKKEYQKKYELVNKEKIAERKKAYRNKNKKKIQEKINEYRRIKKVNDPVYKLKNSIRRNIHNSFKRNKFSKNLNTETIIGCSFEVFKDYLESKWEPWMNWNNYGLYNGTDKYGWDIDHIIPLSSANTELEIIELNHYNNLQPLCSHINRDIKKNKLLPISKRS
jgi:hypothetical protein